MASQSTERERLERRLARHTRVGLDTSIWIYHLEDHPRYLNLTHHLLFGIEYGQRTGVVSVIVLMELTVRPFQLGRPEVAQQYEAMLVHFPNLDIVDVDRDITRRAAQLRGEFGVGAMDALQIATTLNHGATAFLTNDLALARLSEIVDVIILDNFLDGRQTNAR